MESCDAACRQTSTVPTSRTESNHSRQHWPLMWGCSHGFGRHSHGWSVHACLQGQPTFPSACCTKCRGCGWCHRSSRQPLGGARTSRSGLPPAPSAPAAPLVVRRLPGSSTQPRHRVSGWSMHGCHGAQPWWQQQRPERPMAVPCRRSATGTRHCRLPHTGQQQQQQRQQTLLIVCLAACAAQAPRPQAVEMTRNTAVRATPMALLAHLLLASCCVQQLLPAALPTACDACWQGQQPRRGQRRAETQPGGRPGPVPGPSAAPL
jgi:hypothetical protein